MNDTSDIYPSKACMELRGKSRNTSTMKYSNEQLVLCDESIDVPQSAMSPQLQNIFEAFRSSPFRAAPERDVELKTITERIGICVRLDPRAEDWLFDAMPSMGKRIVIGTRTLERFWAFCYGYSTIITESQKAGSADRDAIKNNEEYLLAFAAINWALQNDRADIELPWPEWMPDPRMTDLEHTVTANEFFLMAVGRALLHEIAHVVFAEAEQLFESPIVEEFHADEWADKWMLDRWKESGLDENISLKRRLGIALAYAPGIIFGFKPRKKSESHPSPIERVLCFIDRTGSGPPSDRARSDFPLAFLWMILLDTLGKNEVFNEPPPLPASYHEAFSRYAEYF